MPKKAPKVASVEESEEVMEDQDPPTPCGAWAFILGASLNAFCRIEAGHKGHHQTEINVYAEPRSHFVITWALEDPPQIEPATSP